MQVDEKADFKSMGRSNRPLDAQVRGAGKGDDRRPTAVAREEFAKNWCRTFGHRPTEDGRCANGCGATWDVELVVKPKRAKRTS
jgi:hypothetical protein